MSFDWYTAHVLTLRDRFQVFRIHATAVPAQMVNSEPFRDWTDEHFIRPTMCIANSTFIANAAVAVLVATSDPIPTRLSFLNLVPEPFNHW